MIGGTAMRLSSRRAMKHSVGGTPRWRPAAEGG